MRRVSNPPVGADPPKIKPPQQKWHHFHISEKGQNSLKQKWYYFRKGSKILDKNGTILVRKGSYYPRQKGSISEKGKKSSTKMVPFRKGSKILNKNGTILGRGGSKFFNKNRTISENGQNSSTKMVPFQKKGQKSSTKLVPNPENGQNPRQNGTISVRKGS